MKNDNGRIIGDDDEDAQHTIFTDAEKGSMMGSMVVVLREGQGWENMKTEVRGKRKVEVKLA
jgi:hypothetical protein